MKILAFGASFSKESINRSFASYIARLFNNAEIEILHLNNYELPLFTVDVELEIGIPTNVKSFLDKLETADFLVITTKSLIPDFLLLCRDEKRRGQCWFSENPA